MHPPCEKCGLVEFAHEYSQKTRQTISGMVEGYLRGLREQGEKASVSEKTARLYGILSEVALPDKKEMRRQFHEKSSS